MAVAQTPAQAMAEYAGKQPGTRSFCVAYSGGMDSHVLLHTAAELFSGEERIALRAVHINHELDEKSDHWEHHCEFVADALGVPLTTRRVQVDDKKSGPEAGARIARYEAFAEILQDGEHLLLAQHADDQAETFLLQALRGSGPDGLASIPRKRTFHCGYMVRPFLSCTQSSLQDYAHSKGLSWINDPSNSSTRFDRNFLRHEVLPLVKTRWPSATQTLSRSAMRSAAASQTLMTMAQEDLSQAYCAGTQELSASVLNKMPRERAYNAVRLWVRKSGFRMPRLQDLRQLFDDVLQARNDANSVINMREYEFRRHRDKLYLLPVNVTTEPFEYVWKAPFADLYIKETGQILSAAQCQEQGLLLPESGNFTVRSRAGGELIKLGQPAFHKSVKKVLQEASVPPWERESIPLLYIDGRLALIWNVTIAVDFRATMAIT